MITTIVSGIRTSVICFVLATAGFAMPAALAQNTPDYAALMAAPDRSDTDKQADKRRDPLPFLAFIDVRPGMKVLDMGAGGGYSTEMLARCVAPNGTVYGQNAPDYGGRAKDNFEKRLVTPAMKVVAPILRKYDDPVPPDLHDLDLITFLFFYHDVTYMPVDRAEMNRKLFGALKPGGFLVIADHSAPAGAGTTVARTLHRVDESTVRSEMEAAGFKFVEAGNFWRNASDPRDFNVNRPTGPVDNFVLKFQKPM
jgi:predicted methyltransferase